MRVNPSQIVPSQDFLKPDTVRFIFKCIEDREFDKLPPSPIVREDAQGRLVAIDGHNLIAVKDFLGQELEVHVAQFADDGISEIAEADKVRNQELKHKFDSILEEREMVKKAGINTFSDLIAKYPETFY